MFRHILPGSNEKVTAGLAESSLMTAYSRAYH